VRLQHPIPILTRAIDQGKSLSLDVPGIKNPPNVQREDTLTNPLQNDMRQNE
jgi:hypothetical protein